MRGKVSIFYSTNIWAKAEDERCEAHLTWNPFANFEEREYIVSCGKTFEQAREKVIAEFKALPLSEDLEIE